MNCTFFGHRDAPSSIKARLKESILYLQKQGVECFYVGNNGGFDALVQTALLELSLEKNNIKYFIVTSFLGEFAMSGEQERTIFPEGQELTFPRFAISKRNEWLLNNSSHVIAYVKNSCSNSYKFVERAKRKGLSVINLAEE